MRTALLQKLGVETQRSKGSLQAPRVPLQDSVLLKHVQYATETLKGSDRELEESLAAAAGSRTRHWSSLASLLIPSFSLSSSPTKTLSFQDDITSLKESNKTQQNEPFSKSCAEKRQSPHLFGKRAYSANMPGL